MNNSGNLGNDVRNWLHYDDLTTTFFKQSARARQVRDERGQDYQSTHPIPNGKCRYSDKQWSSKRHRRTNTP